MHSHRHAHNDTTIHKRATNVWVLIIVIAIDSVIATVTISSQYE